MTEESGLKKIGTIYRKCKIGGYRLRKAYYSNAKYKVMVDRVYKIIEQEREREENGGKEEGIDWDKFNLIMELVVNIRERDFNNLSVIYEENGKHYEYFKMIMGAE